MLFLQFATKDTAHPVEALEIADITADIVVRFLKFLEVERNNGIATRNARLAAIHTFVRFIIAGHPEHFTILGAWDSEPEKGVISYLTPLAQSLFNKKPGEEVEFEMDGSKKRFRVESIAAFKTA